MNKIVNVNISGVAFTIEVSAYERLNDYLNTIKLYYKSSEEGDEIMEDIEARIAELFKEYLEKGKEVVEMRHVEKVISIMGEAEVYKEEAEENGGQQTNSKDSKNPFYSKKLYRDPDESTLGGVCAGLGHYFGIDKIWFRLAFILALIVYGFGLLPYIIMWIIIPAAKTTSEKLEMKGEAITVDNIGNAIKNEFSAFKKKVETKEAKDWLGRIELFLRRIFNLIFSLIGFALRFIVKMIALVLMIVSFFLIVSFLFFLFDIPAFNISIHNMNFDQSWLSSYADLIFTSSFMHQLALVGLSLVLLIPLLGIFYGSIKAIFKIRYSGKAVGITAISLWVLGVILLGLSIVSTAGEFSTKQNYVENNSLTSISSDTLNIEYEKYDYGSIFYDTDLLIDGDQMLIHQLSLTITRSKNQEAVLHLEKFARGKNRREAGERAKNIQLHYKVVDNQLSIREYITAPTKDRFRKQELKASLAIPVGMTIYLAPETVHLIYDIKNVTNTYDGDMVGHYWKMTSRGLECLDCNWSKPNLNHKLDSTDAGLSL